MILTLSDIKINVDFENLIPKLTSEQFTQLEENMAKEGRARNPLVIWKGHDVLTDGHNRLRILKAHPELKWNYIEQEFADEEEIKEWIIKNALGTRNLTEIQYKLLLSDLYKVRKKKHGGDRGVNKDASTGRFTASTQNGNMRGTKRVSEQLAEELGIAKNTVIRAEQLTDGLDAAEKVLPGTKDKVVTGELKAQKGEVIAWRKQTPEQIKKSVAEIEQRDSKKRKSADRELSAKIDNYSASMASVSTTKYGLQDLLREIDALGDSFLDSLDAMIKRRTKVVDAYEGGAEKVAEHIGEIINKINTMKKGFENGYGYFPALSVSAYPGRPDQCEPPLSAAHQERRYQDHRQ